MINLVALPCLCVDVFDGTDELRAGGEALNFAVHASKFEEFNVSILGAVGQDSYAKFIMDSVSDKRIDVSHVRVEEDKVTANNRTYLTADGDRYYKDDSWTGDIVDKMILNQDELDFIKKSEVVFIHFWAGCFEQIIDLKKNNNFRLAVDFVEYRRRNDNRMVRRNVTLPNWLNAEADRLHLNVSRVLQEALADKVEQMR